MKYYILIASFIFSSYTKAQVFNNRLPVPKQGQLDKIGTVRPRAGGPVALKPAIDLSSLLPNPGMQGYTQGSCAAWSLTYGMMTYLKQRQERWSVMNPGGRVNTAHVYSPSFLYNETTIDRNCKKGIYLHEALKYCIDIGSLPLSRFSYDPNSCNRRATSQELKDAQDVHLLSFNKVFDSFEPPFGRQIDIVSVKAQLNDSIVLPMGVHIDQSIIYNYYGNREPRSSRPFIWNQFLNNTAIDTAYHAMLCVGYNDTLRAFKFMNSWDVTFGDRGFLWISEIVFVSVVKEAYAAVLQPPDTRIRPLFAREKFNNLETQNLSDDFITDTNWIKKGYYREYNDLRVGCLDLNTKNKTAIIRLTNIDDDAIITTAFLKVKEDYQIFRYKGKEIRIRIQKIDNAGKNPFRKAVFYDLQYISRDNLD